MIAALDAYLATAPLAEVLTYAAIGMLAIGLGPFAVGNAVDHVLAVRGAR